MASRAGLFDPEFDKKAIFDPEMNSDGIFDPDLSQTATAASGDRQEWLVMATPRTHQRDVNVSY